MKPLWLSIVLLFTLILTSCGTDAEVNLSQANSNQDHEGQAATYNKLGDAPLTLTLFNVGATFTDTEFEVMIAAPIKAKYPNVTIERITPAATTTVEEVLSTHNPDLIFGIVRERVNRTGAYQDLREYIQKYEFDESRLKPIAYDYIKEITKGKGDAILALPFNVNQQVTYYNKDIFRSLRCTVLV